MSAPVSPCQVLVMARLPDGGQLLELIGAKRWLRLQEVLLQRACAWAADVAPGAVHVAYEPADVGDRVRALLGPDVDVFPQGDGGATSRVTAATLRVLDTGPGPVLIAWPDLPVWRREHGTAALDDLSDGCAVSVGPVFDGGFYLLALARQVPEVFGLPERAWRSPDAMALAFGAAHAAGLEVGLLRAERGLHSVEDARASLADPLLDAELRGLLASPV